MSAQQILIGFGCLLVLIGILGGGFELKELKIPAVSGMARTIAGAVGIALIILSSYMSMQSASQQAPSQTAVPSEARKPYTKNDLNSNILVISASYGNNCGAPRGNVTRNLAIACDGTTSCTYRLLVTPLSAAQKITWQNGGAELGRQFISLQQGRKQATRHRSTFLAPSRNAP